MRSGKFTLGLCVTLLFCAASLCAQAVKITWVGQACFYISDGATTVVTDPPAANIGYVLPDSTANVVTISHNHADHNFSQGVKGTYALVDGRPTTRRTEVTASGLPFIQIPGFHDNTNGSARGPNTLVRWTQGGLQFAHMGDYGQDQLTPEQMADMKGLDVLFVAAGGNFTPDARAISGQIAQIAPRVAILMHYRTGLGGPATLAGVPGVAAGFNNRVQYKPAAVTISRATLPTTPEVWLMEPLGDLSSVNPGSYTPGVPVGGGSVVSLFGSFAGAKSASAATLPLPRKLEDTEVLVDGAAAPLLFVSPGQINIQAPAKAATQALVEVRVAGQRVGRGVMNIVQAAPGLLLALNQDGRTNTAANPARAGETVQLYATGLGPASPTVEDGVSRFGVAADTPSALVGGVPVTPHYAALVPGLVGIWRVDVLIPGSVRPGDTPVSLTQGFTSASLSVAIR